MNYIHVRRSSKIELQAREHHYITTLVCINKKIPFITDIVIVNGNMKEWSKEYYEANKEKISEYKKQPYICECGSTITIHGKYRHLKTQKHTKYSNSIIIE